MQELLDLVIYEFGIVDVRIVPRAWDPHKGNALDFIPLLIERAHVTCPIPPWRRVAFPRSFLFTCF